MLSHSILLKFRLLNEKSDHFLIFLPQKVGFQTKVRENWIFWYCISLVPQFSPDGSSGMPVVPATIFMSVFSDGPFDSPATPTYLEILRYCLVRI